MVEELATLEAADAYAGYRNAIRVIAEFSEDWSGIPMPLDGMPMIVEPKWPKAKEFMEIGRRPNDPEDDTDKCVFRNHFTVRSKGVRVWIWNEPDGTLAHACLPNHHLSLDLSVLGAADAWGIEQEHNALVTLGGLIRHRQFKQYVLTGSFLERSERSGVHYLFRRLRPTLALREDGSSFRILCALCMHPIAYYQDSWAGAMCPTDDLVAHLSMMRADEHMFWRRSNQHAPHAREAGI